MTSARRAAKGGLAAFALAAVLVVGGAIAAMAAEAPYGGTPEPSAPSSSLITTYGVRAGSAGPDFLGITNANVDLQNGTNAVGQSADATQATTKQLVPLALWGGSVNQSPNPYYKNLLYHAIEGESSGYNEATTWMYNGDDSSWGDSDGTATTNAWTGKATISGLEYSPRIIFGADKYCNWNLKSDGSNSETVIYDEISDPNKADIYTGYDPTFTNNDATNLWTQVYTLNQLAKTADDLTGGDESALRYGKATENAVAYERGIRGQMLYVASQIDAKKNEKKTVAYLYAIDADDGTAYFFTPTAEGLLKGNDAGNAVGNSDTNPSQGYASNNSTINMGYMATLPFVTDTFDSGEEVKGGIVMKVEDIYKANPACTVASTDKTAMNKVDVIIYNSTTATSLDGTSGGKNSSGVATNNTVLNDDVVHEWATAHNFHKNKTEIIAGDDFGTSTNQATTYATAPTLYCQRNYTADKNTRAAWAFSQVYPEFYDDDVNASYVYWLNQVYHVNAADVSTVLNYQTNQATSYRSTDVSNMVTTVSAHAETGYDWWINTGSKEDAWSQYAYYNGSSRGSYYTEASEEVDPSVNDEPTNTIGIFEPSDSWQNSKE